MDHNLLSTGEDEPHGEEENWVNVRLSTFLCISRDLSPCSNCLGLLRLLTLATFTFLCLGRFCTARILGYRHIVGLLGLL